MCSGWHDILKYAAEDVNAAIVEATKTEMPRDIIRWNAKREMLDRIESYILETRKERSRIEDEANAPEPEPEESWVNW